MSPDWSRNRAFNLLLPRLKSATGLEPVRVLLEANMGGDKKPSAQYFVGGGHGKTVVAGVSVREETLRRVLRTTSQDLVPLEHIGLGRYGDPIEARGPERAASELERVLAPGGRLYLSTPIGRPRVQFNSQRIFSTQEIVRMFSRCTLKEFSVVDAASVFRQNVPLSTEVEVEAAGSDFGLGMFVFEKRE